MIIPRPYQREAFEALDEYLRNEEGNPCVVIPTGGGKSIMIAWAIENWKKEYPPLRVCVAAHRKELVQQNRAELLALNEWHDVGVYATGLKRWDTENSIIYAMIDSIYNKAGLFAPFDILIIDEAHRIPANGEGKYLAFISDCKRANPNLKVIGFTATPYRMGMGNICHRDHVLNKVCYEANVGDLIHDGYLCNIRSKVGDIQPNLEYVKRNSSGDYILQSLAKAVDQRDVVAAAVQSAMKIIFSEGRKSIVFFCVDQKHCENVSVELRKYGLEAPVVTAKTPAKDRDRYAEGFKSGRYHAICNVNVYTEGFNAKRVDCIVDLRPTLSKGLFVQKVGRGLRLHPDKKDCLYLDYGHNIEDHGPIDCVNGGDTRIQLCADCGDTFSWAVKKCVHCGWEIPKIEVERVEAEIKERKLHEAKVAELSILGRVPDLLNVDEVNVFRHTKPGKPDSIRVVYRCGMQVFREWICLDHGGFAEAKARLWWSRRFGDSESATVTVNDALGDMFLGQRILNVTKSIYVVKKDKNLTEIVSYNLHESTKQFA